MAAECFRVWQALSRSCLVKWIGVRHIKYAHHVWLDLVQQGSPLHLVLLCQLHVLMDVVKRGLPGSKLFH